MHEIVSCLARESIACAAAPVRATLRRMVLYDYLPSGNGYKVRLLLRLLAIPFKLVQVDILRGESRTPEFLRKNPEGRIPVLQLDDGTHLFESNAILCYLAEGTPWLPAEKLARAQVLQWLFWEQYSHEPNIATVRHWILHLGVPDEKLHQRKRELGNKALSVMERHLDGRQYFVGDRCTIADLALYAYTHVAEEGRFSLAEFPRVRAWLERVRDQPGFTPITQP
jgi:glutathione S-transferase